MHFHFPSSCTRSDVHQDLEQQSSSRSYIEKLMLKKQRQLGDSSPASPARASSLDNDDAAGRSPLPADPFSLPPTEELETELAQARLQEWQAALAADAERPSTAVVVEEMSEYDGGAEDGGGAIVVEEPDEEDEEEEGEEGDSCAAMDMGEVSCVGSR